MESPMTQQKQIAALGVITTLVLDQQLSVLRAAQAQRAIIRDRLAALDCPAVTDGLTLAAAERADVAYQAWADQRRMQLNLQLAQQNVRVIQAETAARTAFAKDAVIAGLKARIGR
jgi:hypothetical protein